MQGGENMHMEDEAMEDTQEQVEDETVKDEVRNQEAVQDESVQAPTDEWTAAALAHASVLLSLILGAAGGVGALIGPIICLAMYFGYREKSRFVAFHALQACIYQAAGMLLYTVVAAVLGAWVAVAWTVSGALAAVLVGLLLMPFALLLTLTMVFLLVCAPFVWLGYGLYAAYQVYQGRDFRYWLVGEQLERQVKL
jgi:uncharacterized Tic20 family protein